MSRIPSFITVQETCAFESLPQSPGPECQNLRVVSYNPPVPHIRLYIHYRSSISITQLVPSSTIPPHSQYLPDIIVLGYNASKYYLYKYARSVPVLAEEPITYEHPATLQTHLIYRHRSTRETREQCSISFVPMRLCFDQYAPFPDHVPRANIASLSFDKLLSNDASESEKLFEACRTYGFFHLNLQGSSESERLLGRCRGDVRVGSPGPRDGTRRKDEIRLFAPSAALRVVVYFLHLFPSKCSLKKMFCSGKAAIR